MQYSLRSPVLEDGVGIHNLVKQCPPLDQNSRYCNLLQASHFRDSSIVAECNGELVGFVTGYWRPDRECVLFVWQVAVSPTARGQRLGQAMLEALVERNVDIEYVETTVTPDNDASCRMFEMFASGQGVGVEKAVIFNSETHFEGEHENEVLYRIGPFEPQHGERTSQ